MLLELTITLTGGLLLAVLAIVAVRVATNQLALLKFKKLSRGLPMCRETTLIGNHTRTVLFGENNCKAMQARHAEMGKTVGFLIGTKFAASTIDLDFMKSYILDEPDAHLDRTALGVPAREFEDTIMLVPKEEWQVVRRAFAPALTPSKFKTPNVLREIEDSIDKLVGLIERKIGNRTSQLIDVDDAVQRYAAHLVGSCFYKQHNLIDFDDPNDYWIRLIEMALAQIQTNPLVRLSVSFPLFAPLLDWFHWYLTEQGRGRQAVLGLVRAQTRLGIEARRQLRALQRDAAKTGLKVDPNNFLLKDGRRFRRNLIDHVIDQYLDKQITRTQYENNSCFLLGAAVRTASDCIGHTIYLLSIHQDVQDRLRKSVAADGAESEYLDWVLKESLRVFPPAPTGCSRSVSRDFPVEGGHVVPKGTYISTNAFVIHRLKEYWGEDADEFKPERWRDTSGHHPLQYIPFGAGPRGCPGRMFAMHEMKMLFAALMTRYKFEGEPRADAYDFESPLFVFVIPRSATKVVVSRLE